MEDKKRLAWFILLRVEVVSVFLVSTIRLVASEPGIFGDDILAGMFRLIIATYLFSIISLIALRFTNKFQQSLTYAQIVWDLLLVTLLILLSGGITSPFSFLYLLLIINASVLLARKEAIYTASLCAILYGSILDFQYYGKLGYFGISSLPAQQSGHTYVFYTIFLNILAYFLTAFLTGYLAERVKRSESALHDKEIDYAELERLYSSIVHNLDNGLVTLNTAGEIRVFNRFAEDLTGISQEEAYGRLLTEIIPGFPYPENDGYVQRKEIEFLHPHGIFITLGFKATPLFDKNGTRAGVIVTLQDISSYKKLEAELKKADRLAAIGELSARMAHEIRNPLASISGSVQLISQGNKVDVNDRKLLEIVLRETDRLNDLIGDFLAYARPIPPVKMPILVKQFLSDLISLLYTDQRFEQIEIENDLADSLSIMADRYQIQQVFWNLLVNSADAMQSCGTIVIGSELVKIESDDQKDKNMVIISISDNGKGMHGEEIKQVFNPFFTTKPGGTGLGLATVYRIIENHEGDIQVESVIGKGTTFKIFLPI